MTTPDPKKMTSGQLTPIPKPRASQAAKLSRKYAIPFKIIKDSCTIWLGAYSAETIPAYAYYLQKQITFIDTAIDCIEYITSSSVQQQSVVLIISNEYATDRKTMSHMLDLEEIKRIYVILDASQQSSLDWFFNDKRIEPINNDVNTVLKQLLRDEVEKLTHFDEHVQAIVNKNTNQSISIVKHQQPNQLEHTLPLKTQNRESFRTNQGTTTEAVEELTSSWKGFVTVGYQHVSSRMSPIREQTTFGERTATTKRFGDRESTTPDNDWPYGRGPFVYHWHPPRPNFRNVRRLR